MVGARHAAGGAIVSSIENAAIASLEIMSQHAMAPVATSEEYDSSRHVLTKLA